MIKTIRRDTSLITVPPFIQLKSIVEDSFCLFVCLFVFYDPSTARSFRDGNPIYCPLRRTTGNRTPSHRVAVHYATAAKIQTKDNIMEDRIAPHRKYLSKLCYFFFKLENYLTILTAVLVSSMINWGQVSASMLTSWNSLNLCLSIRMLHNWNRQKHSFQKLKDIA